MHPPSMQSMFELVPQLNSSYSWSLMNSSQANMPSFHMLMRQNYFKEQCRQTPVYRPAVHYPKPMKLVPDFMTYPDQQKNAQASTLNSRDNENDEPLNLCLKDLSNDMKLRIKPSFPNSSVCSSSVIHQKYAKSSSSNKTLNRFSLNKLNKSIVLRRSRKSLTSHATCAACFLSFPNMNSLNQHFLHRHQTSIKHWLSCMPTPKNLFKAQLNQLLVDGKEPLTKIEGVESSSGGGYNCPKCSYRAKWPTELQKHVMVHSANRPFVCFVCSTSYKWSWDLGRHFSNSHPEIPNPYKKHSSVA